jgi:hypothetical protein
MSAHLLRQHIVDIAIGQVALFFAYLDQAVDVVFKFVVYRQNVPTLFGTAMEAWSCPMSFNVSVTKVT